MTSPCWNIPLLLQLSLILLSYVVHVVDSIDTVLDDQFCQHYYNGAGNCERDVRPLVRSEIRAGVRTLEMGDIDNNEGVIVFFHGWPDTSGLWSNQFEYFCNGVLHSYYCIAPSLMEFHPDGETTPLPYPNQTQTLFWDIQVERFHSALRATRAIKEIDLGQGDSPATTLASVLTSQSLASSSSKEESSSWSKLLLQGEEVERKEGGAIFVTFDFGAIIGYQFAYRYPQMVKRMVAMDLGMSLDQPTPPFDGMEQYLPKFQRNNIDAFLSNDNNAMMDNINNEISMFPSTAKFNGAPCSTCRIAPAPIGTVDSEIGIGAKTGWLYYQIIRTDMNTSFAFRIKHPVFNPNGGRKPILGNFDSWEFNLVPSFPVTVPILYIYSDKNLLDDTFEEFIKNRNDGSQHKLIKNSDHWFQIRNSTFTNKIMDIWFTVLDHPNSQNIQIAQKEFANDDDEDDDDSIIKDQVRPTSSATTVLKILSFITTPAVFTYLIF